MYVWYNPIYRFGYSHPSVFKLYHIVSNRVIRFDHYYIYVLNTANTDW